MEEGVEEVGGEGSEEANGGGSLEVCMDDGDGGEERFDSHNVGMYGFIVGIVRDAGYRSAAIVGFMEVADDGVFLTEPWLYGCTDMDRVYFKGSF
jgi:hypothetical protein